MALRVVPQTGSSACAFVRKHHSHHDAPRGPLFAVGVEEEGRLCCVAIAGRPVSQKLDQLGHVVEVVRVASDGTRHAASMCLGAITRMALAGGYTRLISYTILGEPGTSYRATGWRPVHLSKGGEWSRPSRPRKSASQPGQKIRWETGPDAMPLDPEVDRLCRESVGKIDIPGRRPEEPSAVMELFADE